MAEWRWSPAATTCNPQALWEPLELIDDAPRASARVVTGPEVFHNGGVIDGAIGSACVTRQPAEINEA
ncbi:hypothetical protein GCM10027563_02170 [Parasphingorhabdus pacifica]